MLQMIDTTYRRSSSLYCHQTTDRIGTEASANPVCGERLVHLTEVTAIWVLTGEHLTGEITAEELCLCTLPVEMVPVAVIAPTHQIFRAR
ncbi:hypothetical protein PIC86_24090 (plasmid) [Escherichia coli]|uniref:hypothetical protein n=1 Tax=Escherichia coli TaxID=562 RepID=UPI0022FD72BB|nr:hypothetical protein [Escherichia coli]WBZ84225.1 hypothetical protein PIC86_24090 [Escherichia coli]